MGDYRLIVGDSPADAWVKAFSFLDKRPKHRAFNVVARFPANIDIDSHFHKSMRKACRNNELRTPHEVISTIFPYKLYRRCDYDKDALYKEYLRPRGMLERIRDIRGSSTWGEYFERLIAYPDQKSKNGQYNQLDTIINFITDRKKAYSAAYFMQIPIPSEGRKIMGAPCLNYLALQLHAEAKTIDLFTVFRNHYFSERAYGNYIGLAFLLDFIASNCNHNPGIITCHSSQAQLEPSKSLNDFRGLVSNTYDS